MQIFFTKYEGCGNDFIIIDDRKHIFPEKKEFIVKISDRHFGIGADGVLLLRDHDTLDFEMVYYNSDGSEATFCGNGGRCIVSFAKSLGIIGTETRFLAADGIHSATVSEKNQHICEVKLEMSNPVIYSQDEHSCYLNTGTWHYVEFVKKIEDVNVREDGRILRYQERFSPHGSNINFVEFSNNSIKVRTYEKGVEDETLACGTGVTASAIAVSLINGHTQFEVRTEGGLLAVQFKRDNLSFTEVYLTGPATKVFEGQLNIG
ncbi:MAG: diaminopimelate epimerase [Bacteroidales bacterium]|nr:diaminopimelate epimerase [Bacteroidales bacterium]